MLDETTRRLAAYKAAVAPNFLTKGMYLGKVTQREHVTIIADDGTPFEKEVEFHISWDSISKILALISERAER
ncbi:hypothetical protein [Mesorhizobium sp. CN2-181]|uniref:hypothetical protein n=1 Tax=Mesorhizobium yinganensis TaxID=3157707 RepID=UPI0032B730BE